MMFYLEYTVSKYSMSMCYSIAQFLHALVESRYNIAIFDMVNIHHARKACFKLYKTTVLLVVKFTLLNGMPWWHIVSTVTVISVSLNSFAVILLQYFSNYLWQGGYVITHVCCPFVIGISQKFQQISRSESWIMFCSEWFASCHSQRKERRHVTALCVAVNVSHHAAWRCMVDVTCEKNLLFKVIYWFL